MLTFFFLTNFDNKKWYHKAPNKPQHYWICSTVEILLSNLTHTGNEYFEGSNWYKNNIVNQLQNTSNLENLA